MSRRPAQGAPDATGDESFLGRWSRRKRDVARGVEPDDTAEARGKAERADDADAGRISDEPVLTDADMPDVDSIDETSSVAEFFSPGVSEALRRKALRKLFHSPKFNVRDGLDDFDDDYTHFEKLGDVVTSDMKHRMELEAEKLRERQLAELEAAADAPPADEFVAARPQAADQATGEETDAVGDDGAPDEDAPEDDEVNRIS